MGYAIEFIVNMNHILGLEQFFVFISQCKNFICIICDFMPNDFHCIPAG